MLRSLRNRLILSHILPMLIILPLMGIGLIAALETQVYLPALSNELEDDARLMAQLTAADEEIWQDAGEAQALVSLYSTRNRARMMLLDPTGVLVASNDAQDQQQTGRIPEQLDLTALQQSASGEVVRRINAHLRQGADVIDVYAPVNRADGALLGFVRISYPFASLTDEIYQLRFLIFILLAFGLLLGSGIGYALAVSVSSPVRQATQAISALAQNSRMELLNVYGPEEMQSLTRSVNELVARLREVERSRRHLLANLVHEIGRPLGALRSAITALSTGAEKDAELYHDLLSGMDGETERLQHLLNDLSGLYEQVLGTIVLERERIDLGTWLPGILSAWQAAAQQKEILWQQAFQTELPPISADPTRLAQVLGNLADNAIKFTPPGGTITVLAAAAPGQMAITIRDTGPGMSAEEQEKIFQPFYQGQHGQRFPRGMGLGLSIARDLTQAHGGQLTVESVPGEGSSFTVWLPVKAA